MQQMKPKWLLQEVSGHIKHAALRAAVFSSGCMSVALELWAGGRACTLLLSRGEQNLPFVPWSVRVHTKSLR